MKRTKIDKISGDAVTPQELQMLKLGVERYRRNLFRLKESNREDLTDSASLAKQTLLSSYKTAIQDWIECRLIKGIVGTSAAYAAQLSDTIEILGIDVVTSITASSFIESSFSRDRKHTIKYAGVTAISALDFQLRMKAFKKSEPTTFEASLDYIRHRRGLSTAKKRQAMLKEGKNTSLDLSPFFDIRTKYALGGVLIELFLSSTGGVFIKEKDKYPEPREVFGRNTRSGRCKISKFNLVRTYIRPSAKFLEWKEQFEKEHEYVSPILLPSVQPLLPWKEGELTSGGFPNIRIPAVKLTNQYGNHIVDLDTLENAQLGKYVFEAMNRCQATKFRLNTRILAIVQELHKIDNGVLYPMSPDKIRLPDKIEDVGSLDKSSRYRYQLETAYAFDKKRAHQIKRSEYVRGMLMADVISKLGDGVPLHLPVQLDHRGRMYVASTDMFSYQGNDMSKALVELYDGCFIADNPDAIRSLELQGGNLAGLDKKGFDERINWVNEHRGLIYSTADSPLDFLWWADSDSYDDPLQLIAWIIDYTRATRDRGLSHFPCVVDATNNAYQLLSLLSNDQVLAQLSNVTPSELGIYGDNPQDLYAYMAEKLYTSILEMIPYDPLFTYAAQIMTGDGATDRKFVKDMIMAIPYGITIKGIQRKFLTKINAARQSEFEVHGISSPLYKGLTLKKSTILSGRLAKLVLHLVHTNFPTLLHTIHTIRSVVKKRLKQNNKAVNWVSPSGFPVSLKYPKLYDSSVEVTLSTNIRTPNQSIKEVLDADVFDMRKNYQASVPNLIQSIDASILHIALATSPQDVPVFGIHDCIGSSAVGISQLEQSYRKAVVSVFRDHDLLAEFVGVNEIDTDTLKKVRFDFDMENHNKIVDAVLQSRYFIS